MATREMLSNVVSEELWKVARACRILKMEGHGDVTMGHMSLRDPEGRGFWMKRAAIGLGEVRDAADFILLDFDGNRLHGEGDLHIEWPLHCEIIRARADIDVVGHSHPFHAATFSVTKAPLGGETSLGLSVLRTRTAASSMDSPARPASISASRASRSATP